MPRNSSDSLARKAAQAVQEGLLRHEDACKKAYKDLETTVNNLKGSISDAAITMQQTTEKLEELDKTLKEIRRALLGDDLDEHPGLIKRVKDLESAIHGRDGEPGLFLRRDLIWRYIVLVVILAAVSGGGLGSTGATLIKMLLGGG